jgi:hypothetical protein
MCEKIVNLFREIEDHRNGQDQSDGKKERPQEFPDNVNVDDRYAQFPSHKRVESFGTIAFFQDENFPASIMFAASSTSQR